MCSEWSELDQACDAEVVCAEVLSEYELKREERMKANKQFLDQMVSACVSACLFDLFFAGHC